MNLQNSVWKTDEQKPDGCLFRKTIRKISVQTAQGYECRAGHIFRNRKTRDLLKELIFSMVAEFRTRISSLERRFLNQMKGTMFWKVGYHMFIYVTQTYQVKYTY